MRAAVIGDDLVANVIVADASQDTAPEGFSLVQIADGAIVNIGDAYDGENFLAALREPDPVSIPQVVSPRQVRLLLLSQGLLSQVEAMIAQQDEATKITWQYAEEFRRDNPLLNGLAANLGLSNEQIDQFFIQAAAL